MAMEMRGPTWPRSGGHRRGGAAVGLGRDRRAARELCRGAVLHGPEWRRRSDRRGRQMPARSSGFRATAVGSAPPSPRRSRCSRALPRWISAPRRATTARTLSTPVAAFVDRIEANPSATAPCAAGLIAVDTDADSVADTFDDVLPGHHRVLRRDPQDQYDGDAHDRAADVPRDVVVAGRRRHDGRQRDVYFLVPPANPEGPIDRAGRRGRLYAVAGGVPGARDAVARARPPCQPCSAGRQLSWLDGLVRD